ncbi:MAG: hypothetical protein K2O98_15115, partial [Lachnospiraceae bacterium]|nr:hypothetical protein [Lachnospiraceae bacterium]
MLRRLVCSEIFIIYRNKKHKEYKQTDYVVIDRNSKEYGLIESYQKLNLESQKRLEGYLTALREMK